MILHRIVVALLASSAPRPGAASAAPSERASGGSLGHAVADAFAPRLDQAALRTSQYASGDEAALHETHSLLSETLEEVQALMVEAAEAQASRFVEGGGWRVEECAWDACNALPQPSELLELQRLLHARLGEQLSEVGQLQAQLEAARVRLAQARSQRLAEASAAMRRAPSRSSVSSRTRRSLAALGAGLLAAAHAPTTLWLLHALLTVLSALTPLSVHDYFTAQRRRLAAYAPSTASLCGTMARAVADGAPATAAALARFTRFVLVRFACGFAAIAVRAAWAIGGTPSSAREEGVASSAEEMLFASWSAFSSRLAGGSDSPRAQAQGDPQLHARRAAAAQRAAEASDTQARRRYLHYARSRGTDAGCVDLVPSAADSPENEVARLLALKEGPSKGRRARSGRAAWLQVLQLRVNAGQSDVTASYRRLCAKVHPDKCAHSRAGEAMALLNEAREGLLGARKATLEQSDEE